MLAKSTMKRNIIILNLVLICVAILSTEVRADLYDSWAVVENNSGMPGIVASQLSVEVTDPGNGQALFTFKNTGSYSFYISDIFFDDGTLLGIASIDNSDSGVAFSSPASSSNFPGGNTVYPVFQTTFSADNDPGARNGINPGESVGIYFNLAGSNTFVDTINALNVGFDPSAYYTGSGSYDGWTEANLRIGVHVQGIDDGPWGPDKSDTYLLTPVPTSVILGLLGMSVVGIKLRKYA